MTHGMYKETLETILNLLSTFESGREEMEDAGIRIDGDGVPLVFPDGMDYIGHIKFDSDGHPYFQPWN